MKQEQIIAHLQNGEPAKVSLAGDDLDWLVKHDRENRSADFWVAHSLREGAKGQRRSMQYSIDAERRKKNEEQSQANEKQFTMYLLEHPEVAVDLPKLLTVAAPFKIAVDVVMQIHSKAVEAKKITDAKNDKKNAA
jgi:hypothetical protein